MKKLSTRLLALLLMAVMTVSLFIACGSKDDEGPKDPQNTEEVGDTDEDPKLPKKDFGGYNFTFLTQEGSSYNINFLVSEGNSSEPLDDAIARRNALIEEKYNVKICQTRVSDICTEVRTQVMGGNVEFDAMITKCAYLATMAQENLLYDMLKFDLFNWDASYWDSNSKEQLTLGGKLYFANCALNIDTIGYVTYFNKKIIQDYNLTSPFEYMKNDEWTIENWAKLTKSVSKDLDNDGVYSYTDQLGSLAQHHLPRMMLFGAGVRATSLDESGYPRLSLMDNKDKTVAIYDMVKDAITDPSYSYCITCSTAGANGFANKYQYLRYMFTQDHFLFNYVTDSTVKEFANMESEFGIIPYPKYDKNQETYMADYPYNNALFGFPSIISDPDRTATIIEDMNYYSTITIEPTWYDKLLETRYARCEDSERSLKILRHNQVYDLALFYDFGGIRSNVLDVDPEVGNITRNYDKWKKSIETGIKKVVTELQKQK